MCTVQAGFKELGDGIHSLGHLQTVDGAGCFLGDAHPAQMKNVGTPSLNQGSAAQKQAVIPSWSEALLLSHSDSDICTEASSVL